MGCRDADDEAAVDDDGWDGDERATNDTKCDEAVDDDGWDADGGAVSDINCAEDEAARDEV